MYGNITNSVSLQDKGHLHYISVEVEEGGVDV